MARMLYSGFAFKKAVMLIGGGIVCAVFICFSIRTVSSLRVVTGGRIPFSKRTIWLWKVLASIVGAGGIAGVVSDLGFPWLLAAIPAIAVIIVALRERVESIEVPKPGENAESYLSAWERNRNLRKYVVYGYSAIIAEVFCAFGFGVVAGRYENVLPQITLKIVLASLGMIFVALVVNLYVRLWQLKYWPCPRCGCAFRGLFLFPWMPKKCRYCGLERWTENPNFTVK